MKLWRVEAQILEVQEFEAETVEDAEKMMQEYLQDNARRLDWMICAYYNYRKGDEL